MPPLPERELLGLFMLNCSSREILQESKEKRAGLFQIQEGSHRVCDQARRCPMMGNGDTRLRCQLSTPLL
jgi:hypothetical protein